MPETLLTVRNLEKHFDARGGWFWARGATVQAVSDVSFHVDRHETLALVGESGCGKSTIGRCILNLHTPTGGEIRLDGASVNDLSGADLKRFRQKLQVVFQDPFSSLNPRLTIRRSLSEPLFNFSIVSNKRECDERIAELLSLVGLPTDCADRWPHEFSGGQRQRIGIARALASNPEVVVCDEAVSALDVSVKAQIINLLKDLQKKTGVAFLFISHDLAVVENIAHRIAVMYLGKIVEIGTTRDIVSNPRHPYTKALLQAVPLPDPGRRRERDIIKGEIPSPANPPSGCRFHTRCPYAEKRCREEIPVLSGGAEGHAVACHLSDSEKLLS